MINERNSRLKNSVYLVIVLILMILSACGTPLLYDPPSNEDLKALNDSGLSKSNNEFSLDLFKSMYAQKNIFTSPLSASVLLNMMLNGTREKTLNALQATLHTQEKDVDIINKANLTLLKSLQTTDSKTTLRIGNSMWLNKPKFEERHLSWKPEQVPILEEFFLAQVSNLDFYKGEASQINDWAKEATEGKIPKVIEPNEVKDYLMFLLNAIYFKSDWTTQFKPSNTRKRPFFVTESEEHNLDLMHQTSFFKYADINWSENKVAQLIELPYGKEERLVINIILPMGHQLSDLVKAINLNDMQQWRSQMFRQKVTLALPKFKLEQTHNLKKPFIDLGLENLFSPCEADFSGWFEQSQLPKTQRECSNQEKEEALAYIKDAKQSTYIKVDEEGTEAAVVTVIGGCSGTCPVSAPPPPRQMIIERPFFFMIYDKLTESIVFMGAIHNPQG